jgi:hypothetical protein
MSTEAPLYGWHPNILEIWYLLAFQEFCQELVSPCSAYVRDKRLEILDFVLSNYADIGGLSAL